MAKAEHPVTAYANHVLGGKILGGARTKHIEILGAAQSDLENWLTGRRT
jgi:hypothetical protein